MLKKLTIFLFFVLLSSQAHAAAPAFRASGTIDSGNGAVTPGLPTGHALNDILLLVVQSANEAITCPTGYVDVANSPQSTGTAATAGSVRLAVCWKRDNGSEAAPTVADTGNHTVARIYAYSGAATSGNPWDVTAGSVDAVATSTPAMVDVTTTVADTRVVYVLGHSRDNTTDPLAGFTEPTGVDGGTGNVRFGGSISTGTGGGFGIADFTKTSAGAITGGSFTLTSSNTTAKLTIALKPPAALGNLVKDWNGLADASVKTSNGLARASIKERNSLSAN